MNTVRVEVLTVGETEEEKRVKYKEKRLYVPPKKEKSEMKMLKAKC